MSFRSRVVIEVENRYQAAVNTLISYREYKYMFLFSEILFLGSPGGERIVSSGK